MPDPNAPCSCGSDRKNKNCCLRKERDTAAPPSRRAPRASPSASPRRRAAAAVIGHLHVHASVDAIDRHRRAWLGPSQPERDADFMRDLEHLVVSLDEAFQTYAAFDAPLVRGRTAAEDFLASDRRVDAEAQPFVRALAASAVDLYEVVGVRPGEGLDLVSVLRGGAPVAVRERAGSETIVRFDLLLARVVETGAHRQLFGVTGVPRMFKEDLVAFFDREVASPEQSTADALKARGSRLVAELVRLVLAPKPPTRFVTPEGHDVTFGRAEYRILDRTRLLASLAQDPLFEGERAMKGSPTILFAVLAPPGWGPGAAVPRAPRHGQTVVISSNLVKAGDPKSARPGVGTAKVARSKLVIETMSRERLALVRERIERTAGATIAFESERFETPDAASARSKRSRASAPPAAAMSQEEKARALAEFLEEHYATWPDHAMPGLDGKTPHEAARDLALRPRLVEMLKDIERLEALRAREQGASYDVARLRRVLGIEDA